MCVTLSFLIYFILYLRAICKNKPLGVYIQRGDLMGDFMRYEFGALIFEGACTWKGLFLEFLQLSLQVRLLLCTAACRAGQVVTSCMLPYNVPL